MPETWIVDPPEVLVPAARALVDQAEAAIRGCDFPAMGAPQLEVAFLGYFKAFRSLLLAAEAYGDMIRQRDARIAELERALAARG